MDRKREKMGMQCYMKKDDNSLIDVENVETTGEMCRHLSLPTPLNSSLCTFIGMKHISPTFHLLANIVDQSHPHHDCYKGCEIIYVRFMLKATLEIKNSKEYPG